MKHLMFLLVLFGALSLFLSSAEVRCSDGLSGSAPLFDALVAQKADLWQKYREEMLALINRDRKQSGLGAVELDRGASMFAQANADAMAKHDYLSHWALDGTKPYMRWSRAGGTDHIQENVGFFGVRGGDVGKAMTMARFEENFMDSPGHRANILESYHTHVGVGVGVNGAVGSAYVAQEFVDRYVAMYAFTREVKRGGKATLCGKVLDRRFGPYLCSVTYEPAPAPKSVEELKDSGPYEDYGSTKLPPVPPWKITFDRAAGNFWIPLTFGENPGMYYCMLYVKDDVDQIPYTVGRGGARVSSDGAIPVTSIVFEVK